MDDLQLDRDPLDATIVETSTRRGLRGLTLCGRYQLETILGSGGMAQVWSATDQVLGRKVAVKVLHPHLADDDTFVQRFRQEAIAAARLSHPSIVGVFDTCSDGSHEAIVMELLDGTTLRRHLDDHGTIDADTTVRIALRLLDALEAAHRAGLVHRDIKPSNILLCNDGMVKLADFGIAKTQDQTELTNEGALVGTATYLAPEQLLGDPIDARTDLYSLGIVLYECLTARVPFSGDTGAAVALARLHTDPIDPRQVRADVPAMVAETVLRTLQRDPADRFSSAADLRASLLDTGISPVAELTPAPAAEVLETLAATEPVSFNRSERRWLYPALFIALLATALTVAALLVRETTTRDESTDPAASTTVQRSAMPLERARAMAFDPQGGDGEYDDRADAVIDDDADTRWRTETYETPDFFGSKTGVGIGVVLDATSVVDSVTVDGSTNGWSAQVAVIDGTDLSAVDPTDMDVVATLDDVRGAATVDLTAAADAARRTGSIVLIWVTDLGDRQDSGYRVELSDVAATGRVGGGR